MNVRFHPALLLVACLVLAAGCDTLRFAPSERQKQNAWLHTRTAAFAAQAAHDEGASAQLQALADLSAAQSQAYSAFCGVPQEPPAADTPAQVLSAAHTQLASDAAAEAAARPDPWAVADSALEIGIGIAAACTGVGGARVVRFLREVRAKTVALQQVVSGNEAFKKQQPEQAKAFKAAHADQSPATRKLVAALRIANGGRNGTG